MDRRDVNAVVAIEGDAFTTPWQADTFTGLLDRDGAELLVMTDDDDAVVGYAILWCILDQGELANIAIVPARRGWERLCSCRFWTSPERAGFSSCSSRSVLPTKRRSICI